jgi:hypothetical protein
MSPRGRSALLVNMTGLPKGKRKGTDTRVMPVQAGISRKKRKIFFIIHLKKSITFVAIIYYQ